MESNRQRKMRLNQEKSSYKPVPQKSVKKSYFRHILISLIVAIGAYFFYANTLQIRNILEIKSDDRSKWSPDPTVVLTEYLDFECEACRANYPIVKQLAEEFSGDLQIVVRYFPLPWHRNSFTAARAVEAAWKQGKFWQMHNLLFETQSAWWEWSYANQEVFLWYAQQIGLDMQQYQSDVVSEWVGERIERDRSDWHTLWITGTPTFFLNGQSIENPRDIDEFRTLIKAEIIKHPRQPRGDKVHEHADYKVFIHNKEISFSGDIYQSTSGNHLSEAQHLHDNNGNNIHKHLTKDTIPDFFASLSITIDESCIQLDTGEKYCSDENNTLKFFVNDTRRDDIMVYEFSDLDRILISYGAETNEQIQMQLDSVTDMSCMYSATCPERGKPPTETCVVGMWGEC